ncbi:MAG: hypothetical protein AAF184_18295 [Pseudomonadota bacterium]
MNTTISRIMRAGLAAGISLVAVTAGAADLLRGEFTNGDGERQPFLVTGESPEEIVGGSIQMGNDQYTIAKQSRLGLIGAARFAKGGGREFGEYAVMSSSFSEMTATGQPWVKAQSYVGCDKDYNTFVAIYRVYGVDRVNALGSSPYGNFTDDPEAADESIVYCLFSRPGSDNPPSSGQGDDAPAST